MTRAKILSKLWKSAYNKILLKLQKKSQDIWGCDRRILAQRPDLESLRFSKRASHNIMTLVYLIKIAKWNFFDQIKFIVPTFILVLYFIYFL